MLGAQHARENEVFEHVVWPLALAYCGIDHVESHFHLAGVEGGADVVDCCCVAEEIAAVGEG